MSQVLVSSRMAVCQDLRILLWGGGSKIGTAEPEVGDDTFVHLGSGLVETKVTPFAPSHPIHRNFNHWAERIPNGNSGE